MVLDEAVLYRRRGTPQVMAEQLRHLIEISKRPRVDLQVLPLDAGAHLGQQSSFELLTTASLQCAAVDGCTGSVLAGSATGVIALGLTDTAKEPQGRGAPDPRSGCGTGPDRGSRV